MDYYSQYAIWGTPCLKNDPEVWKKSFRSSAPDLESGKKMLNLSSSGNIFLNTCVHTYLIHQVMEKWNMEKC